MEKIKELIKKFCTKEIIFYIIFGVLTTLVNITVSTILESFIHIEGNIASTIGIICSILFAYFTNRKWVFNSTATTLSEKSKEFSKFVLGRLVTMLIEMLGFFLLYTVWSIPFLISKCLISVIVIILNFFISKFFAFKKTDI